MDTPAYKINCLNEALTRTPEYAGVVSLFVELFRYLERADRETGITFPVAHRRLKVEISSGFPLLEPDGLRVDTGMCTRFLKGAVAVLIQAGRAGGEELSRVEQALDAGTIDLAAIFKAILERRRAPLDEAAQAVGVSAPLLEYVCEIPLKAALERIAALVTPEECEGWKEMYCPVCGSRAGMAEIVGVEGKRFLSCSACNFHWPFNRIQCPYCGNEEVEKLAYFLAGEGVTRIDICKVCSRYIKTRDSRKGHAHIPLDVEDLLTIHLDLLAAREGFERGK